MNIVVTFGGSGAFMLADASADAQLRGVGALFVAGAALVYSGALSIWYLFVRPLSARR